MMLTLQQAAALLGMAPKTLYNKLTGKDAAREKKVFQAVKLGGRWKIPKKAIEEILGGTIETPASETPSKTLSRKKRKLSPSELKKLDPELALAILLFDDEGVIKLK